MLSNQFKTAAAKLIELAKAKTLAYMCAENPKDTFFCGKCGTQLPSTDKIYVSETETLETRIKELCTGTTFAGRYQVIEELGKGGMGKVYKVFDTKIKEKVALKLIRPEIAADGKTIERFSNELKFARKIIHKNVCRMHDLHEEQGAHFITMEYVAGRILRSSSLGILQIGGPRKRPPAVDELSLCPQLLHARQDLRAKRREVQSPRGLPEIS